MKSLTRTSAIALLAGLALACPRTYARAGAPHSAAAHSAGPALSHSARLASGADARAGANSRAITHASAGAHGGRAFQVAALSIEPAVIRLEGPRSAARLLVTARDPSGGLHDVTSTAEVAISPATAASFTRDGILHPLRDGSATITVHFGKCMVGARVSVVGSHHSEPISFSTEIEPILTRIGCNQGACHGAQYGKGGFKLSLAGFDPALDYDAISRLGKGRRLALADPARSLLLLKPTMAVPHGGGRRLEPGSEDYIELLQWIRDGAPGPKPDDPVVSRIEVLPPERVLRKGTDALHLVVRAVYSDGAIRDVTEHARLQTLNDAVVACTPDGVVSAVGNGQTAVMVRYGGQAAVATFVVPYPPPSAYAAARGTARLHVAARAPDAVTSTPASPGSFIDRLVAQKQRELGLAASPLCDDRTFIRRVSFDLIGTPPTPDEIKAFLADSAPDRRARLVDRLLARPEYAEYWTVKWGDLLRCNRQSLGLKGMWSFRNWILAQMRADRPVDQFVHDLILAQGSTFTDGPANFYRVAQDAQDRAETTSQVFLGVRLQCARCHHHPFEKWSQQDYYQFAAFFARVGLKGSSDFGLFGNEQVVLVQDGGEVTHPKTGAVMYPTPLGVQIASLPGGKMPDPDSTGDRRAALADWLVSKDNRLFARNIANRYWGYLFSRGIVNPIDDERVTNPPSNPELLDALADELVRGGYDLKHLLRVICTSLTYQRSSQATEQNRSDELFFTHYLPKRLPAETLLDAVDFACATRQDYHEVPLGTRAIELPDSQVNSDFLDDFGRPARLIACECERTAEPNLSQTLRLMNGDTINASVSRGDNILGKLIAAHRSDAAVLQELYLRTLGRPPSRRESDVVLGTLAFAQDQRPVFEDVLVTLLNSKEFLFNH